MNKKDVEGALTVYQTAADVIRLEAEVGCLSKGIVDRADALLDKTLAVLGGLLPKEE